MPASLGRARRLQQMNATLSPPLQRSFLGVSSNNPVPNPPSRDLQIPDKARGAALRAFALSCHFQDCNPVTPSRDRPALWLASISAAKVLVIQHRRPSGARQPGDDEYSLVKSMVRSVFLDSGPSPGGCPGMT